MSEKEGASSDDGNVPLKEAFKERSSNKKSASQKKKKLKKPSENDPASVEVADKSTSSPVKENESEKTKPRKRSKYYVEVDDEDDKRGECLLVSFDSNSNLIKIPISLFCVI